MTYLAVPISGTTLEQAFEQIRSARAAGAEMLELRMDYLRGLTVEHVRELLEKVKSSRRALPVIVTCRDKAEGGIRDYPLAFRLEVLVAALEAGAEFIDIEY
ncbi:MAG: type I 3-dehydroquinate dehydratase, partial [Planctomycetota bacterium]